MAGTRSERASRRSAGRRGVRCRWRQVVAMCLAVAMGAGLLVMSDARPASADSFVITERVRYGRNQAVIVDMGVATFTNNCEKGANDWLYSAADLYVMRKGTEPGLYGQFHD